MKTTYKFTTAILVAGMALAACTKDIASENGTDPVNPQKEGFRTIEVTFDTPTKSHLDADGRTPKFDNGDEIMVSNGNKCVPVTVTVVNGKASFITDLTGKLKAVYPSSAAKIDEYGEIVGVKVPLTQSGFFKDANIAMAEIGITQNTAIFKPQTAVLRFYVDNSIGVKRIEIEELNGLIIADKLVEDLPVAEQAAEAAEAAAQDLPQAFGETGESLSHASSSGSFITVMPSDGLYPTLGNWLQDRVCYVAILPTATESGDDEEEDVKKKKAKNELAWEAGPSTYDLSVTSYTFTQNASNGGSIVMEEASISSEQLLQDVPSRTGAVTKTFRSVSLPAGTLASVFIPYYISVNVGTEEKPYYQNWSYCNLGAFLPEEPGYFFSWANTSGYVKDAYGNWVRACGSEGAEYIKFNQESYEAGSDGHGYGASLQRDIDLYESPSDAAYYAWRSSLPMFGGTPDDWRMPTKAEVDTLLNKFKAEPGRTFAKEDYSGKQGVWFMDNTGNRVFFALDSYWTATYVKAEDEEENSDYAYIFKVEEGALSTSAEHRWLGYHIRPIFGNPLDESTGIRIEPINEGETI